MKKNIITIILILLSVGYINAQERPFSTWMQFTDKYFFDVNTINKNINFGGASDVVSVVEDNDGNFIFALAQKGIFKFDGKQMLALSIPKESFAATSDIITLACDSKNTLWIGTENGLVKFDGTSWSNIPEEMTKLKVITDIVLTASDKVYVSGLVMGEKEFVGGGLAFYNGTDWSHFNKSNSDIPDEELSGLLLDKRGHLWAIPGKNDKGVVKFDGKNWKQFTNGNGLSSNQVFAIATNKSGKVWLGSSKTLMEFDGTNWTSKAFTNGFSPKLQDYLKRSGDAASLDVNALAVEENGTIWIGTKNMGLFSFAQGGLKVLESNNAPMLSNSVLDIIVDKNAKKWIISGYKNPGYHASAPNDNPKRNTPFIYNTTGVTVYKEFGMVNNPAWQVYDSTTCSLELLAPNSIGEDKNGTIWLPTARAGLVSLKQGEFQSYSASKAMHSSFYTLYVAPDDKIYLTAGLGGVKVFEDGAIKDYAKNPNMGGVNNTSYDKDNVLWASGTGGLSRFVNNDWETFKKKEGLPSIIFYTVFRDSKNVLWAGSAKGLVKCEGATFTQVDKDVELPSNDINAIAEASNGKLWLATNKGVVSYDGTSFNPIAKIESLKAKNFKATALATQGENNLWVGTLNYYLLHFDGTDWKQFGINNDQPILEEVTAVHLAKDGKLYIASKLSELAFNKPFELSTTDAMELQRRAIMQKIKMTEPSKILTIYQTK